MKIKIEIEVDTSTDMDERDSLLDLLTLLTLCNKFNSDLYLLKFDLLF